MGNGGFAPNLGNWTTFYRNPATRGALTEERVIFTQSISDRHVTCNHCRLAIGRAPRRPHDTVMFPTYFQRPSIPLTPMGPHPRLYLHDRLATLRISPGNPEKVRIFVHSPDECMVFTDAMLCLPVHCGQWPGFRTRSVVDPTHFTVFKHHSRCSPLWLPPYGRGETLTNLLALVGTRLFLFSSRDLFWSHVCDCNPRLTAY